MRKFIQTKEENNMYGEYVKIVVSEGLKIDVWVPCTPSTSEEEKRDKAIRKIKDTFRKDFHINLG
jgi:hypothetical protein